MSNTLLESLWARVDANIGARIKQISGLLTQALSASTESIAARDGAVTAARDADTSASNASASEGNAAQSESNAASSESAAGRSESNASGHAETAGTFAQDAQTSASSASQSRQYAATSAQQANDSALTASGARDDAVTAAGAAETQADRSRSEANRAEAAAQSAVTGVQADTVGRVHLTPGLRGEIDSLDAALAGKSDTGHRHSWSEVDNKPSSYPPSSHSHTASQISDATATGRAVVTAASQAAARSAIGAGTSNLVLGTTSSTAAPGDHTHSQYAESSRVTALEGSQPIIVSSLPSSPLPGRIYLVTG